MALLAGAPRRRARRAALAGARRRHAGGGEPLADGRVRARRRRRCSQQHPLVESRTAGRTCTTTPGRTFRPDRQPAGAATPGRTTSPRSSRAGGRVPRPTARPPWPTPGPAARGRSRCRASTAGLPNDRRAGRLRLDRAPARAAHRRRRSRCSPRSEFGRARVAIGPLPGTVLAAGAALTVVPEPGDPPVVDPLPSRSPTRSSRSRRISRTGAAGCSTLPRYDVPWYPGPVDGEPWQWPPPGEDVVPDGWRRELRADPRHRGAAGLGAWVAIAWQDRISDGAARQAGAVAAAAQRIRHLTLGLRAGAQLWLRRVPDRPLARLATLVAAARPDAGGRRRQRAAGVCRAHSGARAGAALERRPADAPAPRRSRPRRPRPERPRWAALIEAANRCPEPQKLSDGDAALARACSRDPDGARSGSPQAPRARREMSSRSWTTSTRPTPRPGRSEPTAPRRRSSTSSARGPARAGLRRRVDLGAFASSVAAGVDPTVARPVVVDRVLAGLAGLRAPLLAEPDVAPELDIPLWRFLSDNSPDWLLPGAGDIPPDRVLAVQTNPAVRRRRPDRRERADPRRAALAQPADHHPLDAAAPVLAADQRRRRRGRDRHPSGGRARHRPAALARRHRRSATSATCPTRRTAPPRRRAAHRAVPAVPEHDRLPDAEPGRRRRLGRRPERRHEPGDPPHREYPSFSGTLTPELVFFGFGVPPAAGRDHWLVLEEPPPGYRFRHPAADASADGAVFASATFAPAGPRLPREPAVTGPPRRGADRPRRPASPGSSRPRRSAAELAAHPWLAAGRGPGPPRRPGAADAQARARRGAARGSWTRSTAGIAALDAELDALDGDRPRADPPVPGVVELARVRSPDAADAAGRSSCPIRGGCFLGAEPRDDRGDGAANRRRDRRERRPRRGRRHLRRTTPVSPTTTCSTSTTPRGCVSIRSSPARRSACCCRCGWRRASARPDGGDPWRLRVRVYPDPVALAPAAAAPTEHEADLVAACWTQRRRRPHHRRGRGRVPSLAGSVGGARAAYLLRTVPVVPEGDGFVATGRLRDQGTAGSVPRRAPRGPAASGATWAPGCSCSASCIPTSRRSPRRRTSAPRWPGCSPSRCPSSGGHRTRRRSRSGWRSRWRSRTAAGRRATGRTSRSCSSPA